MRRTAGLLTVLLVLSAVLPGVHAGSLWDDVFQKIPLIQNQFYVSDIAKFGMYLCGLLIALGTIMWPVGYAFAGDRPEAAPLMRWGKRLMIAGGVGILLIGIIPYLISWWSEQTGASGVGEVPSWGAGTVIIRRWR